MTKLRQRNAALFETSFGLFYLSLDSMTQSMEDPISQIIPQVMRYERGLPIN
jgi:hypothetical protein